MAHDPGASTESISPTESSRVANCGPTGLASLPPEWLASRRLPIIQLDQGASLYRVHQLIHGAVFFGPTGDRRSNQFEAPRYRFDSQSGAFGVLYAAKSFSGAFVESLLRQPAVETVSRAYLERFALTELTLRRPLRLVAMHGPGLSRLGLTNAISTGPYPPCQVWTDYLRAHADKPDGIAYLSRHDPTQLCYAIFEPAEPIFDATEPTPFATMMPRIRAILSGHGKMLLTR